MQEGEIRQFESSSSDEVTCYIPKKAEDEVLPVGIKAILVVVEGHGMGREYEIKKWWSVLGRDRLTADLIIDDKGVSRRHAALSYHEGVFQIEDMDSTNGTIVNGELIKKVDLKHGDKMKLGETVLQFILEQSDSKNNPKVYELDMS